MPNHTLDHFAPIIRYANDVSVSIAMELIKSYDRNKAKSIKALQDQIKALEMELLKVCGLPSKTSMSSAKPPLKRRKRNGYK